MTSSEIDALSRLIIGAAINVHKELGPGLLETFYQKAMEYELKQKGLNFKHELVLPVTYKGEFLGSMMRQDIVVEDEIIVELKATAENLPIFECQLLTYLRIAKKRLGLLINFGQPTLKEGLSRVVNRL